MKDESSGEGGLTSDQRAPRILAVRLRLAGQPLGVISAQTGLSGPTITALYKAYSAGGWAAVETRASPGRPKGGSRNEGARMAALKAALIAERLPGRTHGPLLTSRGLAGWLSEKTGASVNERTAIRRLVDWGLMPPDRPNQGGCHYLSPTEGLLWARGPRSEIYLLPVDLPHHEADYVQLLSGLLSHLQSGFTLTLEFAGLRYTPTLATFLQEHPMIDLDVKSPISGHSTVEAVSAPLEASSSSLPAPHTSLERPSLPSGIRLTHLQRLEAESIQIMREVVAEANNPVMLYSIGKDSAVMLHLAIKAFFPARIPFPLLHVDTTWKFQEMYRFRERMRDEHQFDLLVYTNVEGLARGINPFSHGSQIHTDVMKTQALKQALDRYGFDVALGGARRDEEKSRAKERVFSFRTREHRWDPKNQRPELWGLYNTRKHRGESIRVFPLSNWTELDIWQYIYLEQIPIVPLYFSAPRPVVERDGVLIMVDDERFPLAPGEVPMIKSVRFRTLGCYPLSGAVESAALTLEEVIQETLLTRTSERQGRIIDHDAAGSMEKKKQEGYF
jgi:sulfate adenylyltransferase subunit 2